VRRPGELHGVAYITQLVEMLINERLYRDLHEAESRNAALRARSRNCSPIRYPQPGSKRSGRALGWEERAAPSRSCRSARSSRSWGVRSPRFATPAQRDTYIATGAQRAREVLGALRWL